MSWSEKPVKNEIAFFESSTHKEKTNFLHYLWGWCIGKLRGIYLSIQLHTNRYVYEKELLMYVNNIIEESF